MCFTCALEEVTGIDTNDLEDGWTVEVVDAVEWPELTPEMALLARLRWVLYECTSATTGGPMHIFTDDFNVTDGNIEFCLKATEGDHWSDDERPDWDLVREVSKRMCELALPMTPAQRVTALCLSWGDLRLDHEGKPVRVRAPRGPAPPARALVP